MQTTVSLQEPFSYTIYTIIILFALLMGCILYFYFNRRTTKKEIDIPLKEVPLKDIRTIKEKYLKKIDTLKLRTDNNKISVRKAYQELSKIIRYFIYEVTNIKVQNYTLLDIRRLNMPILMELMQEYYVPEFSRNSLGNIQNSIIKTRKVIEKWN